MRTSSTCSSRVPLILLHGVGTWKSSVVQIYEGKMCRHVERCRSSDSSVVHKSSGCGA